ncbi:hypothetical protein [Cryobacterium cryoconiti]|uniref:hypothetical protein n=1 Tax=Cryobacterium cryoconiti TaxID=1259239 RepID=UPI00141AB4BB|nr:hypothetical protein [Cryobacterium cryoconiti]
MKGQAMFQIRTKHTIALSAVGIAGLLSIGLLAAQADTGVTPTTPVSGVSSDDTATDVPTPLVFPGVTDDVSDAPDDSDGRVGGGNGADDVNDAPDDSDGRVDDSGHDDSDAYDDSDDSDDSDDYDDYDDSDDSGHEDSGDDSDDSDD